MKTEKTRIEMAKDLSCAIMDCIADFFGVNENNQINDSEIELISAALAITLGTHVKMANKPVGENGEGLLDAIYTLAKRFSTKQEALK